jgi:hypothetical protein
MRNDKLRPLRIAIRSGGADRLAAAAEEHAMVLSGGGHKLERGHDLSCHRELVAYRQDSYDWRKHEAAFNRVAHFRIELDEIGIRLRECRRVDLDKRG